MAVTLTTSTSEETEREINAPIHLDTDARNRRLLDTLLAQGLCAEPEFNDVGLVTSIRVSVS